MFIQETIVLKKKSIKVYKNPVKTIIWNDIHMNGFYYKQKKQNENQQIRKTQIIFQWPFEIEWRNASKFCVEAACGWPEIPVSMAILIPIPLFASSPSAEDVSGEESCDFFLNGESFVVWNWFFETNCILIGCGLDKIWILGDLLGILLGWSEWWLSAFNNFGWLDGMKVVYFVSFCVVLCIWSDAEVDAEDSEDKYEESEIDGGCCGYILAGIGFVQFEGGGIWFV